MIKSFTNKIKTFVFSDSSRDNHVTQSRKRKRDSDEREDLDDDVLITAVKKPRKTESQAETLNYFNTLIVNPYQKMAEWFQKKRAWSEHYFFKKAPNGDSGMGPPNGGTSTDRAPPTTTSQVLVSGERRRTAGLPAPNGNGRPGRNGRDSTGVDQRVGQTDNGTSTRRLASNPAPHPSTHQSSAAPGSSSYTRPSQTSTSVQTDKFDVWHRMKELEAVRLFPPREKSLFQRPARQKFTAIECVRLDEKKKYQQLLQQYTQYPLEKSSHSPDRLAHSPLLHYGSRTDGSVSGSNSSLELYSVPRPPDVRRQKVVPTQKTCVISPPRPRDAEKALSPPQSRVVSYSGPDHSAASEDDVVCIDDDAEDDSDVICISEEAGRVSSPVVNGALSRGSRLDSPRSPEIRLSYPSITHPRDTPDFQSSKYLSEDWMIDLERQFSRTNREAQRKIEEAEIKRKFYQEKHLQKDHSLENQVKQRLRLYDAKPPVVEDTEVEVEEEVEEKFPELTDEMLAVVNQALRPQPSEEILVEGYKLQIRRRDMESLSGLNWLNDEIINFYMNQLVERGERDGKPKVYAFNTFFYPKVMGQGHDSVRRWTRRVDIFSKDYILIPVHLGMHWCLAVIDFKKKMIRYFDSMGGNNQGCLNALKEYLCAESLDKKKQKFDLSEWRTEIAKDIPQQMNGSDCGMFACKFAEYITREAQINFTQENMPYFRKRMVYEIVTKKLLQ
uniref:Sentrin-specific protease 1-like n=1 Tax=Crassostrea virginica TaxID=6565 RepID=A0A8B8BZI9_CRAVI|nr:sentrin-specific protease 1-like [Crassostrea virginica]